jgi:large subunit ribosomal protein L21
MFAVIRAGGRQYKVEPGALVKVDKFDANVGDQVTWQEVLLLGEDDEVVVGSPLVKDAKVIGVVEAQGKGRKIIVFKHKKRKGYKRKKGHRQYFTAVRIKEIIPGQKASGHSGEQAQTGKEQENGA